MTRSSSNTAFHEAMPPRTRAGRHCHGRASSTRLGSVPHPQSGEPEVPGGRDMCGVAPSAPTSREAGFARTCAVVRRIGRWTLAVDGPKKGNQVKEAGRWDKTDASAGDAPRRLEGPPWRPRSTMTPRKRSSSRRRQSLSRLRLLHGPGRAARRGRRADPRGDGGAQTAGRAPRAGGADRRGVPARKPSCSARAEPHHPNRPTLPLAVGLHPIRMIREQTLSSPSAGSFLAERLDRSPRPPNSGNRREWHVTALGARRARRPALAARGSRPGARFRHRCGSRAARVRRTHS